MESNKKYIMRFFGFGGPHIKKGFDKTETAEKLRKIGIYTKTGPCLVTAENTNTLNEILKDTVIMEKLKMTGIDIVQIFKDNLIMK